MSHARRERYRWCAGFVVVTFGLAACSPRPRINRFEALPDTVCPGDDVTITWATSDSVNVKLRAPSVDPNLALQPNGTVVVRAGRSDFDVGISVNGLGGETRDSRTVRIQQPIVFNMTGSERECRDGFVTVRSEVPANVGWSRRLLVGAVNVPPGRSGTLTHLDRQIAFTAGGSTRFTEFEGMSLFGDWVLTYALSASEQCIATTAGVMAPPDLTALVGAHCPADDRAGEPPPFRETCGRIGQPCCPAQPTCNEGATCDLAQCVAALRTCTGALAGASSRTFEFEVLNPTSRCASGTRRYVVADSAMEARACVEREGIAAVPVERLQRFTWRDNGTPCRSGDFSAIPEDAQRCANALCGCDHAELNAECPRR